MSLSVTEREAMIGISMASGWVSVLGSISILAVLFRSQNRLSTTYRRLMCGISITDLFASLVWVFGDLPVPHRTPFTLFAYGNTTTCNIQGFFTFAGQIGGALYMCSLCLYYVLTITGYSSMSSDQNVSRKLEFSLHAVPILSVTGAGLFMGIEGSFNHAGQVCWIAPKPIHCLFDPNVECERGEHSLDHRWWFAGYPLAACFVFILLSMLFLIWKVKEQWSKTDEYRPSSVIERYQAATTTVNEERRHSAVISNSNSRYQQRRQHNSDDVNEAVKQALLYIGAFLLTYTIPMISTIFSEESEGDVIIVLLLLTNLLLPLQGFFNFFIFIRPRLVLLRQSHPNMSFFRLVWTAVSTRTETSMLSRRRRRRSSQLTNNNRPRRGFTARELYMQQRANEDDITPPCFDYPREPASPTTKDEENQSISDRNEDIQVDDVVVAAIDEEVEQQLDYTSSDVFKKDTQHDIKFSSVGSTKSSKVSQTTSQEG